MANNCAVVGVGQSSKFQVTIKKSMAGLVREAAQEALQDAGCTWDDIDAVVIGKAPDFFEGVLMPELYLADASPSFVDHLQSSHQLSPFA